jgi:hypothetical protein
MDKKFTGLTTKMTGDPEIKIIREIKIPEATISLREDGIVHVYYNKNTFLNVELQMRMLEHFNEITQKKKMLFLFEAGEGIEVTKGAKENAIIIESISPVLASAVVAPNLAYRMIANFYIKVKKTKGQYKIVRNAKEGIKWLKSLTF